MGTPDFMKGQVERWAKTRKLSFFQENQGQLFQFYPGRIEALFLHILDPNYPLLIQNVLENIKNPIILKFLTLSQICISSPPKFWGKSKICFGYTSLCVYYWSWIMQSLVFLTYLFQKLSKKKLLGDPLGLAPSPLVKEGLRCLISKLNGHPSH